VVVMGCASKLPDILSVTLCLHAFLIAQAMADCKPPNRAE
jgi:hypothetical protein